MFGKDLRSGTLPEKFALEHSRDDMVSSSWCLAQWQLILKQSSGLVKFTSGGISATAGLGAVDTRIRQQRTLPTITGSTMEESE